MQKSTMLKKETASASRKWYVIDASDLILGRLGVLLADTLRGKNKPTFTPNVDCGDYVIVINSKNVKLSGNKAEKENWYNHSGYMGGLRTRSGQEMINNYSEELIRRVVKGMLPKNRLSRQIIKKLFIYTGSEHPHAAQNPQVLTLNGRK